jgi:hypothetical protein
LKKLFFKLESGVKLNVSSQASSRNLRLFEYVENSSLLSLRFGLEYYCCPLQEIFSKCCASQLCSHLAAASKALSLSRLHQLPGIYFLRELADCPWHGIFGEKSQRMKLSCLLPTTTLDGRTLRELKLFHDFQNILAFS